MVSTKKIHSSKPRGKKFVHHKIISMILVGSVIAYGYFITQISDYELYYSQ